MAFVVGVDGCPGGWIAVAAEYGATSARPEIARAGFFPRLGDLLAAYDGAMIVIDMPIGLVAGPEGRGPDKPARALLKARRSSVFTPPCRAALQAPGYSAANAAQRRAAGQGLSKQAWMLAPKLREIDSVMTPALQDRVREGHPELAFALAAGAPMAHTKRRMHGLFNRIRFLATLGYDPIALSADLPPEVDAAADDLVDACILAHVAARCERGEALCVPDAPAKDPRGLRMEIWS